MHFNEHISFVLVNATRISQFKAKNSEIEPYPSCLENISKGFVVNCMKKVRLSGYVHDFTIDYIIIDNIIDIHKYLMKKHDIKECLGLLKKCLSYY